MRVNITASALLAVSVFFSAGCTVTQQQYDELRSKLDDLEKRNKELVEENQRREAEIADQRRQIETLEKLGDDRLDKIFHVRRIELGRYTGGVDLDSKPGHEGIKVYLKPIDQDGSVIKAAGKVSIRLFDLAAEAEENMIGKYQWSVEEVGRQWSSGFATYHFSFVCPWKKVPAHDEITVRVEFMDYLTGRSFTAQKVCEVKLPPTTQPADDGE